MKRSTVAAVVLLAAGLVPARPAHAAFDAFLKIEGIEGESTDARHRGWIEVDSYQLDQIRTLGSATGGAGAGKVAFHDITITKRMDKASPALSSAAATGKTFPRAVLEVRKAGGTQDYLVVKLTNVLVSSYRGAGAGRGDAVPTESLSLNFASVAFEHPGAPAAASGIQKVALAPGALQVVSSPPRITGASAAAPFAGLAVTVSIASTGPCVDAFVDYGDGSIVEGHALTGTSTTLPGHTYPTAGAKTIKIGGRDAPYWTGPKKPSQKRVNECSGWAPEVKVSLRSLVQRAPAVAR